MTMRYSRLKDIFIFCAALLGGWVHASFTEPDIVTAAAPVEQGTEMVISLPVEIDSDVIEPEPEIDPWEGAYISSYLGNTKTKDYKYWFRDLFGQALRKPADFTLVPVSACSAILKTEDRKYFLSCRKG